ncbi:hypothetical protein [Thermoplasma volcanium GSS1]|uniref:ArnR1-like winged helix-turn-helix domain-containing protein n=1 Tax=Thermoplasma volcanium (strain ATCC 51530 / DSM 4299 / JCM 9571 / NBRC 15438 / GSS1) TaxID=273116 RepID=Q979E9_THEVO|nr:winged helix-turn-helix domain-containing protein [Thermoplasma volcanium]BAB60354.1 hypothetical protein [Thermoplasma volcanium GSS1]
MSKEGEKNLEPIYNKSINFQGKFRIASNVRIKGLSGNEHFFDFAIINEDGTTIPIMIAKDTLDSALLKEFEKKSLDVQSRIKIVVLHYGPAILQELNELMWDGNIIVFIPNTLFNSYDDSLLSLDENRPIKENDSTRYKDNLSLLKKKRTRLAMVLEMLSYLKDAEGGLPLTRLFFRCNLNYKKGEEIVKGLLDSGMVKIKNGRRQKNVMITPLGENFLRNYSKLHSELHKI